MFSIILRIVLAVACLFDSALADKPSFGPQDADRYDKALYGRAPVERLHSTDILATRILRRAWDEEQCASPGSHYLIGTRGREAKSGITPHAGPIIINNDGHQVWFASGYQPVYNFRTQIYRGEQVLTFWAGKELRGGHGEGQYYMLDKHYREIMRVSAYGNYTADLHEFKITQNGQTALLTSYPRAKWDYERWPTSQNETDIWDSVFQEIDLETGELLFQWTASEHFAPKDCFNPKPERPRAISHRPIPAASPSTSNMDSNATQPTTRRLSTIDVWDWFHINSIDKDDKGDYLISSRYSHSLTNIDHQTGKILWQLGGNNNSFLDLSKGRATQLAWQHHATWVDNYTAITVFDNEAVSFSPNRAKPTGMTQSRGLKIRIDQEAMTAELIMEALHPQKYSTQSQGSIQQLENGNFFIGYGNAAAMTEFSSDGEVVCDLQYGALHYRANNVFSPGGIQSYRVFKTAKWKGYPLDSPKFIFDLHRFYVSWNGATEVREWVLEGEPKKSGQPQRRKWVIAGRTKWAGLESEIQVSKSKYDRFRLNALDGDGMSLGKWSVLPSGEIEAEVEEARSDDSTSSTHILYFSMLLLMVFVLYKIRGFVFHRLKAQFTRKITRSRIYP